VGKKLKRSFCGRSEAEVTKLVAGSGGRGPRPSVYICDGRVEKVSDIISKSEPQGPATGSTSADDPLAWGSSARREWLLLAPERTFING